MLKIRLARAGKRNMPFFSRNGELPTIIINAVKSGLLFPYTTDSVNTRMSKETFLERLKLEEEGGGLTQEEIDMGFGAEAEDDFFGGGGDVQFQPCIGKNDGADVAANHHHFAIFAEKDPLPSMPSHPF